jgi:hypothetical protein
MGQFRHAGSGMRSCAPREYSLRRLKRESQESPFVFVSERGARGSFDAKR